MSREKQIEEMVKTVSDCECDCLNCKTCYSWELCEALYNAGYRKQEWISVDERLPDKSGKYIVCNAKGMVYQTKFYTYPKDQGGHWGQKDKGRSITHWMHLPEAPKGGAE